MVSLQQQRVLNIVKVSAEIDVDDSSLLLDDCLCHAVHRFMCSSFESISIRSRLKVSFEDRFQNELKSSLDHTVTNRRNRKNANFATVLGISFFRNRMGRYVFETNSSLIC